MRLWSLHPKYLDPAGLVAVWREALLARVVLAGETRGYRHHPQLLRFREHSDPPAAIAAYLESVFDEAARRDYRFDRQKVPPHAPPVRLAVTSGQLAYEWEHLAAKVRRRNIAWSKYLDDVKRTRAHPLFRVVAGAVEPWERSARSQR